MTSLESIVESETAHFCDIEQSIQQSKGRTGRTYEDTSLHSRTTNCGIATALIQHNLREHHGIETVRLFGEPPLAPRTQTSRKFGHIILRTEDILIDPTYGQLFTYVGIPRPLDPNGASFIYPERLALTIDTNNPDAQLGQLVNAIDAASYSDIADHRYGPLRQAGSAAIHAVIRDIYNPVNYIPYEVETFHPLYDYIQSLKQESAKNRKSFRRKG